jgi:8-oxo-dGTP pyrophosphatase MutT (NUDIX family)
MILNKEKKVRTSHTVRTVLIQWKKNALGKYVPCQVMVHQHASTEGIKQKKGPDYYRRESIGLPGGRNEGKLFSNWDPDFEREVFFCLLDEEDNPIMETLIETAVRELWEETGIVLSKDSFSEYYAYHGPLRESDRPGTDYCGEDLYFAILPEDVVAGEIQEKKEVKAVLFIPLNEIPLPKDRIPFSGKQLKCELALLRSLETKVEDASELLRILEKHSSFR